MACALFICGSGGFEPDNMKKVSIEVPVQNANCELYPKGLQLLKFYPWLGISDCLIVYSHYNFLHVARLKSIG